MKLTVIVEPVNAANTALVEQAICGLLQRRETREGIAQVVKRALYDLIPEELELTVRIPGGYRYGEG